MLIGDVLAVVASLFGIALTSWATLLAFRLMFPRPVELARREIDRRPWANAFVGTGILLIPGGIFLLLLSAGPAPVKIFGFVGFAWLLAIGAIGAAGLAASLESRMEGVTGFARTSRATAILVGASNLPLLGWFVFGPAVLMVALGAGARAILRSARSTATVPPPIAGEVA